MTPMNEMNQETLLPAEAERWDGAEETQAEEDWDDNHPLRTWVPGTGSLAPWVGTPGEWIVSILQHANISKNDVLCDVGCGDGRIPIIAHQYFQATAIGIDLDRDLIDISIKHAERRLGKVLTSTDTTTTTTTTTTMQRYEASCDGLSFVCNDALQEDLSAVTLMVVYLLPESFDVLAPLFRQHLSRSTDGPPQRLVVVGWKPPDMVEIKAVEFGQEETATSSHVYYYDASSLVGAVESNITTSHQ
jgi:SAM-dependent methyltransferase